MALSGRACCAPLNQTPLPAKADSNLPQNLILGQSLRLVLAGIIIGLPVSIAAGGLYSTLLFGVRPVDLPTIVSVIVLLSLAALAAAYIPSRRAARVEPDSALRSERLGGVPVCANCEHLTDNRRRPPGSNDGRRELKFRDETRACCCWAG
jgi:hypothetical protein